MRLFNYLLPLAIAACGLGSRLQAYGQPSFEPGYATEKEAEQRDMDALQEYIKTKRAISITEKGGNLMISGDVRGEWYCMHDTTNYQHQRGWPSRKLYPNAYINQVVPKISHKEYKALPFKERVQYRTGRDGILPPFATNEFDVEANLVFDYVADRGWGTIRLQFSNPAGIITPSRRPLIFDNSRIMYGSGQLNDVVLRKCFAGYNLWEQGTSRFDVEIGRRRFYEVFDSRIQFWNFFDGTLARFTSSFEGVGDLIFEGWSLCRRLPRQPLWVRWRNRASQPCRQRV